MFCFRPQVYTLNDYPVYENKKELIEKYLEPVLQRSLDNIFQFRMFVEWVKDMERGFFKEKGKDEEKKGYLTVLKCMLDNGLERNDKNKNFNEPLVKFFQSENIGWKEKYYSFILIDKYNLNYWIYPKYSNQNPIHLLKFFPYIPQDKFNHLLHKTIICKMNHNIQRILNKEIIFSSSLFLYQAENLLNPMDYPSDNWSWFTRQSPSDGGGLEENITLKSLKAMIKDDPSLLLSQDENGHTILHYIFLSSNYDTTNLSLAWVDNQHQQKIERVKLQAEFKLFIFREIYSFCKGNNINFECLFSIPNKSGNYPFQIINPITTFYFLQESIKRVDRVMMDIMISNVDYTLFLEEWKEVFSDNEILKVVNKVNKFKNFLDTRNELLFMKIKGKAIPMIPKDVTKYILNKFLHH